MTCSHIETCELFVQFVSSPEFGTWKRDYCECNFSACARYQALNSDRRVPLGLLPDGDSISHSINTDHYSYTQFFNTIIKKLLYMVRSRNRAHLTMVSSCSQQQRDS